MTAIPNKADHPPTETLENLPYLSGVIWEGLRHSTGLAHRLWRQYPDKTLNYNGLDIPPMTVMSATALLLHENPDIFPEPYQFKPERWLGPDQQRLRHYLVPFSSGTRSCVGMNLAYVELYSTVAAVFRNFELQLHDVIRERDIDCVRDAFVPLPRPESKGVHIKVVGVK